MNMFSCSVAVYPLYFIQMGTEVRRKCSSGMQYLLQRFPGIDEPGVFSAAEIYPEMISPYYARLIRREGGPIWRQAVPDPVELDDPASPEDPLEEERYSPVSGLVHRYPDRALFLVSDTCPVYCRFCTRKRRIRTARGREQLLRDREAGLEYIQNTASIRDVLLSGGDPLMLPENELFSLLDRLFSIKRLDLVRIGTRVLCTDPGRITEELVGGLSVYPALYINTHFNHPAELTGEASAAARMLASAGLPLGCQTVLLKGINDDPDILEELFRGLLGLRIRPYYLHLMDHTKGTAHFRLTISRVFSIYKELQKRMGGMALPRLMLDIPGGGGKVALDPHRALKPAEGGWIAAAYNGSEFFYPENGLGCD